MEDLREHAGSAEPAGWTPEEAAGRGGDGMTDAACEFSCFGLDAASRWGTDWDVVVALIKIQEDATRACDSVCPVCLQARTMPPLCIIACQQVARRRRDMFGPRWRGHATAFLFLSILPSLFRPFVIDRSRFSST